MYLNRTISTFFGEYLSILAYWHTVAKKAKSKSCSSFFNKQQQHSVFFFNTFFFTLHCIVVKLYITVYHLVVLQQPLYNINNIKSSTITLLCRCSHKYLYILVQFVPINFFHLFFHSFTYNK